MNLTHRPVFWIAYAALAAVAALVAWRLFPLAIPILNLDIKLSREEALAKADALDRKFLLSPPGSRKAARFAHDTQAQNYVELEGGGKEAFAVLVAGDVYAPYRWEVRLFKPGDVNEALVRFRPDGAPYGFLARRSESFVPPDPARRELPPDVAQRLAEDTARSDWNVDLGNYTLLEATQQRRATGRVDHTFVYDRTSGRIGELRFRLRLGVTGDTLTEVTYFAQTPESFDRRFVEMRSANNTIAETAALLAGILYGVGGCILGVLWLLRRHWLLWRPALAAGLVVGALVALAQLANTPAAWFTFDTAQSVVTFWVRQIGGASLIALGGGLGYALAFMAAESLSRRAFGDHPQLWRVWSREAAATKEVLGRTAGGYLFIAIELALIAGFYYATNRWLGWWQPSESLTDPNILGAAVPALMPIALSLQAGASEEALFRAIPLSLAAIIGERYGRRRVALGIAIVVQALIFGGAHANYPGFPSYSRLIELIVPSMLWALIFLRFGLVPTVILHALFDLVLFSIPIFLVDAPGGATQRALIIAAALLPLAIIAVRRVRAGAWRELPEALRNRAWQPPAPSPIGHAARDDVHRASDWITRVQRSLPIIAIAGLVAWLAGAPFHADVPPLVRDRGEAQIDADSALRSRHVALGPEWKEFAVPKVANDDATQWLWHRFVWREAGADVYHRLVGDVLAPPVWDVRYAKFEGDVAERAEEWRVSIDPDGNARTVRHTLPEARPGGTLDRQAAQALAEREVRARFGLDPAQLRLVLADEKRRPARIDWTFTFSDPRVFVGKEGEARVLVALAGDEVTTAGRFVHVPEEWQRTERERESRLAVQKLLLGGVLALVLLSVIVMAVVEWTRGHVDRRAMIGVAAFAFAAATLAIANRWPRFAMNLNTAEPIGAQVAVTLLGSLFAAALFALVCGLLAGAGAWTATHEARVAFAPRLRPWLAGAAAALMVAGAGALVTGFAPKMQPLWPSHDFESAWWPALAALLEGLQVLVSGSLAVFGLEWLDRVTRRFTRYRILVLAVIVACAAGVAVAVGQGAWNAVAGVVQGIFLLVAIYAILRVDIRALPALVATHAMLRAIQDAAQKATPDAWVHASLTVAGAAIAAVVMIRYIERARGRAIQPSADS